MLIDISKYSCSSSEVARIINVNPGNFTFCMFALYA